MGLAIFDVCDTLYDTNTTVGFLRFLAVGGNRKVARALGRWTRPRHPLFWLGALSHRLLGHDLARRRLVHSLAGLREEDLRTAADRYVREDLQLVGNRAVLDRLAQHIAKGDRIVLASSSLEPIVEAIAVPLGATGFGSILGYENGRCTGQIAVDLTGAKAVALWEVLRDPQPPTTVYTDNRTDTDLLALADKAVIVIPRGRPRPKWAGEAHEYLQL